MAHGTINRGTETGEYVIFCYHLISKAFHIGPCIIWVDVDRVSQIDTI